MDDALARTLGLVEDGPTDDTVAFEIYAADDDTAPSLEQLTAHLAPFLQGYIWQRQPFTLLHFSKHAPPWCTTQSSRRPGSRNFAQHAYVGPYHPFCWGQLAFGDNVEDEWFITWLLLELTQAFPVTARVWDSDGEFLLIEAAYSLPRWLKPAAAENRVWLHHGCVHVVPRHVTSSGSSGHSHDGNDDNGGGRKKARGLELKDALMAVWYHPRDAKLAGTSIHDAIAFRISEYPRKAREMMHRARALIPARLAHVLQRSPQTISAAVEAFYYRNPYDAKAAARMANFPPEDLVLTSVRFSRCLYAQIALQSFEPPKKWPALPPKEDAMHAPSSLGVKLTAAFEMLLAQPQEHSKGNGVAQEADSSDLNVNIPPTAGRSSTAAVHEEPMGVVRSLMQEPIDVGAFQKAVVPSSDSEAWLRDGPAAMEAELRRREAEVRKDESNRSSSSRRGAGTTDRNESLDHQTSSFDPGDLSTRMKQFMEATAGLEGADIDQMGAGISFDERLFLSEIKKALRVAEGSVSSKQFAQTDDDNDDDDEDEEGSSFYEGSSETTSSEGSHADPLDAGGERSHAPDWDAETATDSDDEVGAPHHAFMEEYARALDRQLEGTTLAETFERAPAARAAERNDASADAGNREDGLQPLHATRGSATETVVASVATHHGQNPEHGDIDEEKSCSDDDIGNELRPVDVDINLVNSLLASYREQGGMPGPVSNLAGLLGIELPDPLALQDDAGEY